MNLLRRNLLLALACWYVGSNLWAITQNSACLGVVRHESGVSIASAKVTLIRLGTGEHWDTLTNAAGSYQFSDMQSGEYLIRVQHPDFETQERRCILSPGENPHLDFALRITELTESIDVTDQVNVLCTVTDRSGRYVTNLTQEDFLVKEDGKRQKVASFLRQSTLPLTVAILVDSSLSIEPILRIEKQTAKEFLRAVLREQDVAIVYSFDRNLHTRTDFSSDTHVLGNAIDAINLGKGTSLHDAVLSVSREGLMTQGGRKSIILISDGEDTTSQARFRDAVEFVQRAEAIVYAISNRGGTVLGSSDQTLKKYSQATGGRAFFPSRPSEIRQAFTAIQEELRSQYCLRYDSTNSAQDGRFRRIKVTLPHHPDLRLRTKKGYFAASPVLLSRQ